MTTSPTRVVKAHAIRLSPHAALAGGRAAELHRLREDEHRQEVDEAYRQGLADGRRQAEQDGPAAVPLLAASVEQATTTVRRAAAAQQAADATAVVDVALAVAGWVLGRELAADHSVGLDRIQMGLAGLVPTGGLELWVAPTMVELVQAATPGADVRADATLAPGEARLVAGAGSADLTFDEAFGRARAALLEDGDG